MPHASDRIGVEISVNGDAIKTYRQVSGDNLRSIMNHDTYYADYEEGGQMQIALKFTSAFDWHNANALKVVVDVDHKHMEEHDVFKEDLDHAEDGVDFLRIYGSDDGWAYDDLVEGKKVIELDPPIPFFRYKGSRYSDRTIYPRVGTRYSEGIIGGLMQAPHWVDTRRANDDKIIIGSRLFIHVFRAYPDPNGTRPATRATPLELCGDLNKPCGVIIGCLSFDKIAAAGVEVVDIRKHHAECPPGLRSAQGSAKAGNSERTWKNFWCDYRQRHIPWLGTHNERFRRESESDYDGSDSAGNSEVELSLTKRGYELPAQTSERSFEASDSQTSTTDSDDSDSTAESLQPYPFRRSTRIASSRTEETSGIKQEPSSPGPSKVKKETNIKQEPSSPGPSEVKREPEIKQEQSDSDDHAGVAFAHRPAPHHNESNSRDTNQKPIVKQEPGTSGSHTGKVFAHRPAPKRDNSRPKKKRKLSSAIPSEDYEERSFR